MVPDPSPPPARSSGPSISLVVVVVATMAAVVAGIVVTSRPAAADELARFSSCAEAEAWATQAAAAQHDGLSPQLGDGDTATALRGAGDDAAVGGIAREEASTAEAGAPLGGEASAADGATGATNVIVEGIDEGDRVDVVDDRRIVAVVPGEALTLLDLDAGARLARIDIAGAREVSYDPDRQVAWVVADRWDTTSNLLTRVGVGDASLDVTGTWSADGDVVGMRRDGDRVHLVVSQWLDGSGPPFADTSVECTDVWRPDGRAGPTATMGVTFRPEAALEPVATAAVVGAGTAMHLTADAAYVATALAGDRPQTSIHRFDLDGWSYTGSGRVDGFLLNDFAMDESGGHLRVAHTIARGGGAVPMPMPVDDVAVDPAEPAPSPGTPEDLGGALNRITVLDLDGDLDPVGATELFGHPGETIHGVRFVGSVAYAVTFLTTDPFYVVDLAEAAAPRVVGEVELPGFSSYLHPIAEGFVAGFGPDGDGRTAVKLFDVSDPTAPTVVDDDVLGDESPVAWDHHAYLALGPGQFAVPALDRSRVEPDPGALEGAAATEIAEALGVPVEEIERMEPDQRAALGADIAASELAANPDVYVVEGAVADGQIELARTPVESAADVERVLARPDGGWVLVSWATVTVTDGAGAVRHAVQL